MPCFLQEHTFRSLSLKSNFIFHDLIPRLKAGDVIDVSIPMHGEGCMPQAAALRVRLRVPARNE